ncbi:MAG: prepilin-type N-terminal cleavage/methylation domain-containing protein, partial [Verrucomicrobiales bacterium]
MTTSAFHAGRRARSGISLLEVLISIGILSIGLLSTLALIPAGRFYMKRAAVDDRAAAVIPSAFAALNTQGMLRVDASSWRPWQGPSRPESESEFGRELTSWTITSTTTEVISDRYSPRQRTPLTSTINGSVPPPSSGNTLTVNLKIATSALSTNVSPTVSQTTGAWTYNLSDLAAPDMQINESGKNVGEVSNTPYADYTFTATYTNGTGPATSAPASPSSIRQYGKRRSKDLRRGRAQATYQIPSSSVRGNET